MIVKILKSINLYIPIKRLKDDICFFLREQLFFNQEMIYFYKDFIKEGDICFDLGAAYGNRTKHFLKLGASKVVTVEPTTYYQNKLKRIYGKNNRVEIIKSAISDKIGTTEINICSSPTLSTLSQDEISDIKQNPEMRNLEWTGKETINTITIDSLIEKYGKPNFIKIDIEGYEVQAFKGLSHAIPKISFEYHTRFKEKAIECIELLSKLGNYEFNYSSRESMKFNLAKYVNKEKIIEIIKFIPPETDFGDIYCKLKENDEK